MRQRISIFGLKHVNRWVRTARRLSGRARGLRASVRDARGNDDSQNGVRALYPLVARCLGRGRHGIGAANTLFVVVAACIGLVGCGGQPAASAKAKPRPVAKKPTRTDKPVAIAEAPVTPSTQGDPDEAILAPHDVGGTPFRPPFLPDDDRPRPDVDSLGLKGIRCFESKRLRLYTDLPEDLAATLPPLADRLHETLEAYFGLLPSMPGGGSFQVNGYLMRDRSRFDATELVPFDLPQIQHGRHRGYEFWMNDQTSDYYRRHLLLHEYTHCFMTITPHPLRLRPWYIEGMAERFATHEFRHADRAAVGTTIPEQTLFDVFPSGPDRFEGWGRVQLVREAIRVGEPRTAPEVFAMAGADFATDNRLYAWSWAMCRFLEDHPLSKTKFREVSRVVDANDPDRSFVRLFRDVESELAQDWWLFAHHLCHGFDLERAATTDCKLPPKTADGPSALQVRADRGWQGTGVMVEKGRTYRVRAEGRCVLATTTKPWTSEPDGVSIRYNEGRPIGRLLGTVRPESEGRGPRPVGMLDEISLGSATEFTAPRTGTLYLRVNDFWNALADNTGEYGVRIEPANVAPID